MTIAHCNKAGQSLGGELGFQTDICYRAGALWGGGLDETRCEWSSSLGAMQWHAMRWQNVDRSRP